MSRFGRILVVMSALAVWASPALAQSLSTSVSNDGTQGLDNLRLREAQEGTGDSRPFVGGKPAELTGAAPVSEGEALAAVRDFIPMTAGGGRETVLGLDTRGRIYPYDAYPYRAVTYITFSQNGGSYSCSGAMIGPDTVLTAGHCVHSGGSTGS